MVPLGRFIYISSGKGKKRRKGPRFGMQLVVEVVCRNPGAVTSVRETGEKMRCEISAMLATAVGAER